MDERKISMWSLEAFLSGTQMRPQFRGHFPTEEAARAEADRLLGGYDEPRRSELYRITPFYSN